jgi:hypothetical protein
MPRLRAGIAVVLAFVVVSGVVSLAQRFGVFEGAGAGIRVPPKDFNDGGFTICKWMFRSDRSEAGGIGWSTDYPFGEINLLTRLSELTKVHVSRSGGDVNYWVVQLTDDQLFECPMLVGTDVGTAALSKTEVQRLRQYLLKGGFLWVDDFWGSYAWDRWVDQIARVLPPHQYPIADIPVNHAIMHTLYDAKRMPQVPSINHWYRSGGQTSERGADSAEVTFRGISDEKGRLMIVMTHNTDIADTWEREGENREYFERFSPEGYAIGVNFLLYAMTH